MKYILPLLFSCTMLLPVSTIQGQDPLSDCEIYLDELELRLKKDQKDTRKYYELQLEEGNEAVKRDLGKIRSNRERKDLKKEYKVFVRRLEREFNEEMDKLEDEFFEALRDAERDCGAYAVRQRAYRYQEYYYRDRRSRY